MAFAVRFIASEFTYDGSTGSFSAESDSGQGVSLSFTSKQSLTDQLGLGDLNTIEGIANRALLEKVNSWDEGELQSRANEVGPYMTALWVNDPSSQNALQRTS